MSNKIRNDLLEDMLFLGTIPQDIYTLPDTHKRRLKVSTATAQEFLIANGLYFVGSTSRDNVPVDDTYYSVLTAPADKYLVVEDARFEVDFSGVSSGTYSIALVGFASNSNGNSWTYTPLSPIPTGRSLNTEFVNTFPESTIDKGVTATLSGDMDYPLFFTDYYVDTQRNRQILSSVGNNFFDSGRQIVIAPSQSVLIRTVSSGTSAGGANFRTIFYTSEIPEDIFPIS